MPSTAAEYWERRASRYGGEGEGLQAVCSYGMPAFYNGFIHLTQRLALDRWLRVAPDTEVLDIGCGVGRWSRRLARRGARVTGVDLSPTMLTEASRRAREEGIGERCRFLQADVAEINLGQRFPLILAVTVFQHVMEPGSFHEAVSRLAVHLAPEGKVVLLEAAPSRGTSHVNGDFFQARTTDAYVEAFSRAGLRCASITGVDPAPFKILLLPYYRRLPRAISLMGLALATGLSLPIDAMLGRAWTRMSWHKVFVLEHADEGFTWLR